MYRGIPPGRAFGSGVGESFDRGAVPHGDHLLYVFFLAERTAGAGSRDFKLYRPHGCGFDLCSGAGGEYHGISGDWGNADHWICGLE